MGEILVDDIGFHFGDALESFDADGVSWYATRVTGIRSGVAPELAHTARPGAHGVFRGDAFRGARSIEIEGVIAAPNKPLLRESEERLIALCSDHTRLYSLRYQDEHATRYLYVELGGEVITDPRTHFTSTFNIALAAPDPRKWSEWISATAPTPGAGSGGIVSTGSGITSTGGIDAGTAPVYPQVTVMNTGTAPGILVAQFVGPATNPALLNVGDGRSVMFRGSLGVGESLWVNLAPHDAHDIPGMPTDSYLEGRGMYGATGFYGGGAITVPNGEYPDFPKGSTASYVFVNGQGVLHARPAFW